MKNRIDSAKILLVEDDPGDARLIGAFLAESKDPLFEPQRAGTLREAVELLKNNEFDAVLLDLSLPDSAGLETFQRMSEAVSNRTPIVILTGGDEWLGIQAVRNGAHDYLLKNQMTEPLLRHAISRAIERHKYRESRLRMILQHLPAIVWTVDNNLVFTSSTGSGLEALGLKQDQVVGMNLFDYFQTKDPQYPSIAAIRRALNGETVTLEQEWQGQVFEAHVQPLKSSEGKIIGAAGVAINVTDRKRLAEQLRQAQKMEAVGELAGGIAHDFNNILGAIIGYSDLLKKSDPSEKTWLADLDEILKAANRAASLTHQLLAFSRRQALQPKVFCMNDEIIELEKMLRRLVGENIQWKLDLDPGLWAVKTDVGQFQQAVINLVLNARDAMPKGGRISISTRNFTGEPSSVPSLVPPGAYAVMEVLDTGIGMSQETMSHIFEPFFTTKEKGKGTGLGLAMVYGVIKQSNGYIFVDSVLGKGATFTVYLPKAETAAKANPKQTTGSPRARGSETILVVEDEEPVQKVIHRILQSNGFHVMLAKSGREALEMITRLNGKLDLVISDIVLPDEMGDEVIKKVSDRFPAIRVLFMSGYLDKTFEHFSIDEHVPFLQKPFSTESLLERVESLLNQRPLR